jgi:hypothetical protein
LGRGQGEWDSARVLFSLTCGPAGPVQHAVLDAGAVSHSAHQAVQCVDLAHECTLPDATHGRVAAHFADGVDGLRNQGRARAHSGGGAGRFAAGMAAADDDDVVWVAVLARRLKAQPSPMQAREPETHP